MNILVRAGYDPHALIDLLAEMKKRLAADTRGFGRTHPTPESRIQHVAALLGGRPAGAVSPARQQRFASATASVR